MIKKDLVESAILRTFTAKFALFECISTELALVIGDLISGQAVFSTQNICVNRGWRNIPASAKFYDKVLRFSYLSEVFFR